MTSTLTLTPAHLNNDLLNLEVKFKEKLKYNFFHILLLYSKFYNCFLRCCAQGLHYFVIPYSTGHRKVIFCRNVANNGGFETQCFKTETIRDKTLGQGWRTTDPRVTLKFSDPLDVLKFLAFLVCNEV